MMSKLSKHSFKLAPSSSTPKIDKSVILPIIACAYPTLVFPLLYFLFPPPDTLQGMLEARPENRMFWPVMAAIAVVVGLRNHHRLKRLTLPPHIVCLLAYLAFAGASTQWAFRPELSFIRFVQEVMVLISIILPAILALRTTDMMRCVFILFGFAATLNVFFVLSNSQSVITKLGGYPGYFTGKNLLGEFSAVALLLALHEMLYPSFRRALGAIVMIIATALLVISNSKTALALVLLVPLLAKLTIVIGKRTRISFAIILMAITLFYLALSSVLNFNMSRLSYMLYGDPTFSGRTIIWDFAQSEIARKPLFGWGYQSFWLVGADAPSIVDAPGFVKLMPNAHNGYYDTMLEVGYIGYALLLIFITATLHAIGRVADRDAARAWLLLSLALYVIMHNYFESTWMRAFDLMWVVFAVVAAEAARHWQVLPLKKVAYGTGPPRSVGTATVPFATRPRMAIRAVTHGAGDAVPKHAWERVIPRLDGET
jgi:O-antigen ligase